MTRRPIGYSKPMVAPTPFGDLQLDLWRQQVRGLFLLAVLIWLTMKINAR